jgi:glycosyltransferase involved in cell wall biosynthesis
VPEGRALRVLHLNPAFKLDGPGRGILALMRYLPASRVRSTACSLSPAESGMEALLREHQIRHVCLGMRGVWDVRAVFRLARLLRQEGIQILHTNLSRADWVGRLAARMAGTPVVVSTIRNLHREMYRAEFGGLAAALGPRIDRWTGRWTNAFIALSEDVHERLLAEGHPPERIWRIPNSVDLDGLDLFERRPRMKSQVLGLSETTSVVGTVAVFKEQKGFPYLIEAAALIRRGRPGVRFVVVGSGPKESEIARLVAEHGVASAFVFVGQQTDIRPYLACMDVFVLPSLWEGMPRALMEAMGAGIPAVGTAVSGIRDLIEDGVTGLLVPPRDPSGLAGAVLRLLADPTHAQSLAAKARERIRERHSAEVSAVQHATLYAALLRRSLGGCS